MSFQAALARHMDVFRLLSSLGSAAERLADDVERTFRDGGKLLFFGNGGSAADSQHLAAEFVVRFTTTRRALPALALTVDTSVLTAQANDIGFSSVFSRQVEALCSPRDMAVGISTSGGSANVVEGIEAALRIGARCWGWSGSGGGRLGETGCAMLRIPSTETARIQEAHLFVGHWICEEIDRRFAAA